MCWNSGGRGGNCTAVTESVVNVGEGIPVLMSAARVVIETKMETKPRVVSAGWNDSNRKTQCYKIQ